MKDISNEKILTIYRRKLCNLTETAKALGIARSTLYNWLSSNSELKEGIKSCDNELLDFTETQLYKSIKGYSYTEITRERVPVIDEQGKQRFEMQVTKRIKKHVRPSDALIKFVLSTKGRARGYTEKKQIDITSAGNNVRPSVMFMNPNEASE